MKRNTLILRLVVLVGALVAAGVLLAGLLVPRQAGEEFREAHLLSESALEAQLAERGHEVEALRREGGLVHVRLRDGGELWLDGISGREIEMPERRGSALQPGRVREMLRQEGYRDIGTLSWRRGAFEAVARDAEGRPWHLRLDTYSGEILERRPQEQGQ